MKALFLLFFVVLSFAIREKRPLIVKGRSEFGGLSLFYAKNSTISINSLEVNIDESFDIGNVGKNSLFWMNKVRIMSSNNIKDLFKVNEGKVSLIKVEIFSSSGMISEIVGDYGHMKELILGECNIHNLKINGGKSLIKSDDLEIRGCLFKNISWMEKNKKLLQNTGSSYESCEVFGNKFDGCNNVFYNGILSSGIYLKFKSMNNSYLNIRDEREGGEGILRSNCLFINDIFKNNSNINNGGVLYLINSSLEIKNCEFEKCRSRESGGSIYINGYSFVSMNSNYRNCSSENNGGCIYLDCEISYIIDGCITSGRERIKNESEEEEGNGRGRGGRGGGIYIKENSGICNIKNFLFGECKGKYGGGIYISKDIKGLKLYNCYFIFCNGIEKGGAIYIDNNNNNNNIAINNCIFEKNNGSEGKDIFISYLLEEDKVRRIIKNYKSDSEEGINCFGMICLNRKEEEILKDSFEPEMELKDFRKGLRKIKKGEKSTNEWSSLANFFFFFGLTSFMLGLLIVVLIFVKGTYSVSKSKMVFRQLFPKVLKEYLDFYERDIEPEKNLTKEEKYAIKFRKLFSEVYEERISSIPRFSYPDLPEKEKVPPSKAMIACSRKYSRLRGEERKQNSKTYQEYLKNQMNTTQLFSDLSKRLRELDRQEDKELDEIEESEREERERMQEEFDNKYEEELKEWNEEVEKNKTEYNEKINEKISEVNERLKVYEKYRPKLKEYDTRFENLTIEQKDIDIEYNLELYYQSDNPETVEFPDGIPPSVDLDGDEDLKNLKKEFQYDIARGLTFSQLEQIDKMFLNALKRRLK